jgi:hypothetical protein
MTLTTAVTKSKERESIILAIGASSGVICFFLFQTAYWLTTWLAQLLATYSSSSRALALVQRAEPGKWIGASFVLLIAFAATYAWDKIRIQQRLNPRQYWTMIGLALAVCLLAALLSGGF